FAILRGLTNTQIAEASRINRRPAGDREYVIKGGRAIDGEVFHPKGIRDSELVGSQQGHADVCLCIRSLDGRWDVVLTHDENVWRSELSGDPRIEIRPRHVLEKRRVRRSTAVN